MLGSFNGSEFSGYVPNNRSHFNLTFLVFGTGAAVAVVCASVEKNGEIGFGVMKGGGMDGAIYIYRRIQGVFGGVGFRNRQICTFFFLDCNYSV